MNRKTFKASNIQQAIANIKEELGSDAMILNTRKIPQKPLDPYAKVVTSTDSGFSSILSSGGVSFASRMETGKILRALGATGFCLYSIQN